MEEIKDLTAPVSGRAYRAILFAICFISTAFGGAVSTLMSVYLPVAVKDLLGNKSAEEINNISGYINAVFIFGWAFGGFMWGVICDKIGRKKSMLFAIAFYGIFTMLTGGMSTWWGVVIFRFFSGFGVGGVLVTTLILISEVWPARSKAVFIGILSIAFPVGIFFSRFDQLHDPFLATGILDWLFSVADGNYRMGFIAGISKMAEASFR